MKKIVILLKVLILTLIYMEISMKGMCLDPDKPLSLFIIDKYTTENGLPQNSILDIVQSDDGYLWLGTFEGLARFDGISFTTISNSNSIVKKNDVLALVKEKSGRIWIGTNGGGLYSLIKDKFEVFSIENGLCSNYINDLFIDSKGVMWISTRAGISKYENNKLQKVDLGNLSDKFFFNVCEDKNGSIWCASLNYGIVKIDSDKISIFSEKTGLPTNHYGCISYVNNEIWVGLGDRGEILVFGDKSFRILGKANKLYCDSIYNIYEDSDGSIWVGGNKNGIFRYNNGIFENISVKEGLNNDNIRVFYEDIEKNLWVGTYRGGLHKLRDGEITTYNHIHGLPIDEIRSVFCDFENTIWIGTVGGGLCYLKNNKISCIKKEDGLPDNRIWSINETKSGGILIGTFGGGAALLKNKKVVKTWNKNNGLTNNIIRSVYEDSKGNFWFGTNGTGVNIYQKNGKFKYLNKDNGLSGNFIYCFYEDSKGRMWIGTYEGGVNVIDNGKISVISVEHNLSSNCIWSIIEDNENNIWMGTDNGGIIKINNKSEISIYSEKDGLFSSSIFQLIDDRNGNLWLGGNKGPLKLAFDSIKKYDNGEILSLVMNTYGKSDGMPEKECNGPAFPAGCIDLESKIYFPTTKGLVVINPKHKKTNTHAPNVIIEKIVVDGVEVNIKNKKVFLKPNPKNIEIKYTGLSFVMPEKVNFKYTMKDQNLEVNAGPRRVAYLTNLSYGNHYFKVIASNNDGIWNVDGDELLIYVSPNFYETIYFKILCVLLFIIVIIVTFKLKIKRLKEGKMKLQKLVDEKTKELQEINNELKKIANTDWLTGINNHRQFHSMYKNEWKRCARNKTSIALIMIDIDDFKLYNDTYGHHDGDVCLKNVAQTLKSILRRPADFVARYGGEEFVIVLPDITKEGAIKVADMLREAVVNLKIKHKTSKVGPYLTISLGLAVEMSDFSEDLHQLLIKADNALYKSKREGKNRVSVFEKEFYF